MDQQSKILVKDFYICLKRSINNPDLSVYQTDKYRELVAKDLNTGVDKYIFTSLEEAENKLNKLGTQWNLCMMRLPINKIKRDRRSGTFSLDGEVNSDHIVQILQHSLMRENHESITQRKN